MLNEIVYDTQILPAMSSLKSNNYKREELYFYLWFLHLPLSAFSHKIGEDVA